MVRPLDKGSVAEVRRVVALQTDAFHTAAPVAMFDGMAKRFFEAEVLSGGLGICSVFVFGSWLMLMVGKPGEEVVSFKSRSWAV